MEIELTEFMKQNLEIIKKDWDNRLLAKDEKSWQYWEIIYVLIAEKATSIQKGKNEIR